jgi:hypothetical protein
VPHFSFCHDGDGAGDERDEAHKPHKPHKRWTSLGWLEIAKQQR